jgi:AraC-like DNA-binding protein
VRIAPQEQGVPVGALSELPNVMREFGHDPWELLESYGVAVQMMTEPLTPVPISLHGRILQAAATMVGRNDLGLLLGQRAGLENAGPLRHLVFNARTTGEAIESFVRFVGLWYRGLRLGSTRESGFGCMSLTAPDDVPGRDLLLTAYLAGIVNILEAIFGRTWRPSQVHIGYRKPRAAEHYTNFFRAPVLFNQAQHAVYFPVTALKQTREGSDRKLDAFLRQYMSELEARQQPDLVARVRRVIESLLAGGECTIARVAAMFAVHRVTLHRYLREHGITFEQLLDESRRNLARQMLGHTDLAVADIATALGYGAAGSFVRAFGRWEGVTPGAWRAHNPGVRRGAAPARIARRRS